MIAEIIRKNLFVLVAEYRRITGVSLATVSNKFYGNATFLADLRRPKGDPKRTSISIDKLDMMMLKIRKAWPADADWPMLRAIFMDAEPPSRRAKKNR